MIGAVPVAQRNMEIDSMFLDDTDRGLPAPSELPGDNTDTKSLAKRGWMRKFGNRKYINVPMQKQAKMGKKGNKQWVHPPEALLRGHIVYNVKFLGHVEAEQPKGTDVVKEAIRKMKFNKQIKKAEGQKPPKVELTISMDGVTIQEPKYKVVQHSYPLHRISYCADDKSDKRMFTFIAKESDSNQHHCFVFDSEKCAEEITLTVGQAFDLAYRRFLESSGKDMDTKKQYLLAQKKIQQLTQQNLELKARVADLERLVDSKVLDDFDSSKTTGVQSHPALIKPSAIQASNKMSSPMSRPPSSKNPFTMAPIPRIPPPHSSHSQNGNHPEVGRKLENLVLDDDFKTNGAQPTFANQSHRSPMPVLAPPPPVPSRSTPQKNSAQPATDVDLFGSPPFKVEPASPAPQPTSAVTSPVAPPPTKASYRANPFNSGESEGEDPFGMGSFNPTNPSSAADIDKQIQKVDQELLDLQTGFSQGLSFGTADFSLEDLDPLNKK